MERSAAPYRLKNQNITDDTNILAELNSQEKMSSEEYKDDSSDDEQAPVAKTKKRLHQFSDSDTENKDHNAHELNEDNGSGSEDDNRHMPHKSRIKSRIQLGASSSDSDASKQDGLKNEEQQIRMKNKKSKLQQKFKGLLSSRSKSSPLTRSGKASSEEDNNEHTGSGESDSEISSIAKIKQKIRNSMAKISTICDPDTSDEESDIKKSTSKPKQKRAQKSTKMIEAKPIRMSAKQAMENMHLIKSESNRMLREKAVSLPYHRPKALSLKDIMARRKPAVSSDGKALPIKMNEQQLKQYALQLEQRQKEMMELCKSESDDDIAELETGINEEVPIKTNEKDAENDCKPESTEKQIEINTENKIIENDLYVHSDPNEIPEIDMDVPVRESNKGEKIGNESVNSDNPNDSNTDIRLVYDNSIEENVLDKTKELIKATNAQATHVGPSEQVTKANTEPESQLISLHYTENTEECKETDVLHDKLKDEDVELNENSEELIKQNVDANEITLQNEDSKENLESNVNTDGVENRDDNPQEENIANENAEPMEVEDDKLDDFFSDDDVNMEDIERIIENAEIMKNDNDNNSPLLIKDAANIKPKIMGAPGMVIDLDGTDAVLPKRTGLELLKERFTYFAKLKTPEEQEREREKKIKPGAQLLKLKQELSEKIAEQRSLEWAKRLEEEKQQHQEMDSILDDAEEADDSIEKAKLNNEKEEDSSESEEELNENDVEIKDKPRKHNPMLDDEAEESEVEENDDATEVIDGEDSDDVEDGDGNDEDDQNGENDDIDEGDDEESSEEESSESEEEEQASKPKKGRILKAFEDSDDEETKNNEIEDTIKEPLEQNNIEVASNHNSEINSDEPILNTCAVQSSSQDDVLQLAQRHQSASDDLFTSQESSVPKETSTDHEANDDVLGTQTFSISSAKPTDFLYPSQPYHDPNLNAITDDFSQKVLSSQQPTQASQPIGEDILALCTGKFYDNEFVSQTGGDTNVASQNIYLDDKHVDNNEKDSSVNYDNAEISKMDKLTGMPNSEKNNENITNTVQKGHEDGGILKSILDELDDPEFDKPKQNVFFTGASQSKNIVESSLMKKRFVIDSDDETIESNTANDVKKKKSKKKKLEKRALQISDDEEEEEGVELDEGDSEISDIEQNNEERLVEYDSEENEIEVKPDKPKKKRKATDFFEDEAELTSEDEWVGSGDEDEHGLDRMEREEGDDEVFHQGKLQKELGQIHMRDVMDQDKREVRLLQELLFEDGDLGGGHRQRKFRWRNAGDEEAGTVPDEFADTQEEEFESEEQWRKQRHEREVFLRQMQNQGEEENLNVTVNRNTIIKANLSSKSMSTLLMEVNQTKIEIADSPVIPEKKPVKDVPSPKKSFSIFQQNYHGSLLTRGRGALARLAALATPLAVDDDAPKISSISSHKRNFVFTTLTQDDEQPKVTIKRKADAGTPKLVKKMRTEEKQNHPRSSILDHLHL